MYVILVAQLSDMIMIFEKYFIKFGIIIMMFSFLRLLSDIFILDYKMFTSSSTRGDTRREFLESVLPPLEKLKDIVIEEAQTQSNNGSNGGG